MFYYIIAFFYLYNQGKLAFIGDSFSYGILVEFQLRSSVLIDVSLYAFFRNFFTYFFFCLTRYRFLIDFS